MPIGLDTVVRRVQLDGTKRSGESNGDASHQHTDLDRYNRVVISAGSRAKIWRISTAITSLKRMLQPLP